MIKRHHIDCIIPMKYLKVFIISLLCFPLLAQNGKGIEFSKTNLESAFKLAKEKNKLVFIAYENYSGKSRWMDQNVFPEEEVGKIFNENFISLKINSESLRDKTQFSDFKYRGSTATCFFLTPKGELIHKSPTPATAHELVEEANHALKINENFISLDKMDKLFRKGERSTEFLYLYSLRRLQAIDLADTRDRQIKELDKSVRAYMTKLSDEDFATEQNMLLACEYLYETNKNCNDELYQRMMKNSGLVEEFSEENAAGFRQRLGRIIDRSFNEASLTNNKNLMNEVVASIDAVWYEKSTPFYNKENLISSYKIDFYEMSKDWSNYENEVIGFMNRIDEINTTELADKAIAEYRASADKLKLSERGWQELYAEILKSYNEEVASHLRIYGWRFSQHVSDKVALKEALKWLNKSLRLSPNQIALKTYSQLLFKVGREDEAKKYADLSKKSPTSEDYEQILVKVIAQEK